MGQRGTNSYCSWKGSARSLVGPLSTRILGSQSFWTVTNVEYFLGGENTHLVDCPAINESICVKHNYKYVLGKINPNKTKSLQVRQRARGRRATNQWLNGKIRQMTEILSGPCAVGGRARGWGDRGGVRGLARSAPLIVCDPRRADMKAILNAKIKRRESFRPFAP